MGQEYTCTELQYKVPSVLGRSSLSQQTNGKHHEYLREAAKKKKKGNQFIFQCLWQFFLPYEQETLHVHVALGTTIMGMVVRFQAWLYI